MEWERAKNIILIAFVLLNLGLAAMLFVEDSRYTLAPDRWRNINTVLSNNNISLYTVPMRRFPPMRPLDISAYYYDHAALLEIFFEGREVVETRPMSGVYSFEAECSRLEITNGFIFFDNALDLSENGTDEPGDISREEAIRLADEFISRHFPDFVLDIVFEDYGVRLFYYQEYDGRLIYSNEIRFLITSRGIEWIEMQFGRVIGHSTEPRMIFAPDEALLTFMQRMWYGAVENPIIITNMDMVYMREYASDQIGAVYPAVPFYRIFIQGDDFPFLISAYTNVANF